MSVRYGEPLRPAPGDDPEELTRELRDRMAVLLDGTVRAYPDGTPDGAWWVPARFGGGAPSHREVLDGHGRVEAGWSAPSIPGHDPD